MGKNKEVKKIKVAGGTPVAQLSGSIVKFIEDGYGVELRAVGASSVSQMYKSIATARGVLSSKGKDYLIKPGYDQVTENEKEITIMVAFLVEV